MRGTVVASDVAGSKPLSREDGEKGMDGGEGGMEGDGGAGWMGGDGGAGGEADASGGRVNGVRASVR